MSISLPVRYPDANPPQDISEYLYEGTIPHVDGGCWIAEQGNLITMSLYVRFSELSDSQRILRLPLMWRPMTNVPAAQEAHGPSGATVPLFISASTGDVRIPSNRPGFDLRDQQFASITRTWLRRAARAS